VGREKEEGGHKAEEITHAGTDRDIKVVVSRTTTPKKKRKAFERSCHTDNRHAVERKGGEQTERTPLFPWDSTQREKQSMVRNKQELLEGEENQQKDEKGVRLRETDLKRKPLTGDRS